jgi:peptide/nickel transport system permease protein
VIWRKKDQSTKVTTYWSIIRQRFLQHRLAKWSLRILYVLIFITIFGDFIANERPIVCKLDGTWQTPVLKWYAIQFGLTDWTADFRTRDWLKASYEFKILPLIPYSATYQDRKNRKLVSPFAEQNIPSWRFRHWLGTDRLGRDVAAGMIAGTRTAMLVGLISMLIATSIGVVLGAIAGFFGDDRLKIPMLSLFLLPIGLFLGIFYGFIVRAFMIQESEHLLVELLKSGVIFLAIFSVFILLGYLLQKLNLLTKSITLPLDLIIMRLIEVFNSIPALLLILAFVAVIKKPSVVYVMLIIGFIRWTGIARFMRAEILKIKQLEYVEAARALGFSNWRILFRHVVPNALTPVLTTIAFGIAGAILTESALSFLGIGVDPNAVTWGSLLRNARSDFNAWWLAIFPGIAIFISVSIFNLIGEGLSEAIGGMKK